MRIYKKWKNLKPDVKVGLACTAFYFASLATPIYAAAEKELRDPVQPINLEQVINVPQVETLYKEKLAEYSQDKIIEDIEIENLYKIHQKRIVLLKEESATLSKEYSEKWESKLNKLDVKKINLESNLNSGEDLSVLSDVKKGLDKDILRYYPALFESDGGNLNYAADTQLNSELEESFRKLVIEANAILLQYYNDDGLKLLVDKDCYDLNDIAILHNMLNKEKHTDENKRAALLKKIVDTKLEHDHIKALPEVKVINTRIASLDALINRDSDSLEHFKAYFEHKAEVKEFEEKIGNFNKQFSISLVAESILENKGLDKFETKDKKSIINAQEHFKEKNKAITTSLEEYLKAEGFDVEVKDMVNPADTYIPFYLGAIGGLLFPLFRNLLVKGYVRGSRGNGYEYMGSTMAGLVNGSIGLFLIDGLHPLVYPIRMFATPFILQPIFKMTGFDPAKIFAES